MQLGKKSKLKNRTDNKENPRADIVRLYNQALTVTSQVSEVDEVDTRPARELWRGRAYLHCFAIAIRLDDVLSPQSREGRRHLTSTRIYKRNERYEIDLGGVHLSAATTQQRLPIGELLARPETCPRARGLCKTRASAPPTEAYGTGEELTISQQPLRSFSF